MKIHKPRENTTGLLFVIYYLVGVTGLSITVSRELFIALMPFSLLASFVVVMAYHKNCKPVHILLIGLIALAGFLVEVAGVLTGEVFGQYSYGPALGLKLFETPLMIGINWIMLVYGFHAILENLRWPRLAKILAGASMMVIYDFIMEPVAISLNMWNWGGETIPLQNYVAWFVISLVFLTALQLAKIKTGNAVARWLIVAQTGFFFLLNVFL